MTPYDDPDDSGISRGFCAGDRSAGDACPTRRPSVAAAESVEIGEKFAPEIRQPKARVDAAAHVAAAESVETFEEFAPETDQLEARPDEPVIVAAAEPVEIREEFAPEAGQLEARLDAEANVAAAESVEIREVAVASQELGRDPGWLRVAGAMAALVLLFSLLGFGLVQLYYRAPAQLIGALEGAREEVPAAEVAAAGAGSTGAVEPAGERSTIADPATSSTATSPSIPPSSTRGSEATAEASGAPVAATGPSSTPTTGTPPALRRSGAAAGNGAARSENARTDPAPQPWRWKQPIAPPSPPEQSQPAASRSETASSSERANTSASGMEPVPVPSTSSFSAPEAGATAGVVRASDTGIVSSPVSDKPVSPDEARRLEAARIRAILLRYENAYNRLDANAAASIWPGADHAALSQAFSGLNSQRVSLGLCDITVIGDIGGASCVGKARWQNRGGGRLQTADRRWTFNLRKVASEWRIEQIRVRDLEP